MNNSNTKIIKMPSGTVMTLDECIYNLCSTRDIGIYLDALFALRDKYLIILSVKDTPGHKMGDVIFEKVLSVGFSELTRGSWRTYIGVIDRGKIVFNKSGEKPGDPLEYSKKIGGLDLSITSKAYLHENISEIIINGVDYSLNSRGWNIVVFDYETNKVIDSATYDSHYINTTLYHMNMAIDSKYFESHFFIKEKYKNDWFETYRKSYFSDRKLGCKKIDNGIIEPIKQLNDRCCGGVCDEKFNFVAGHVKKAGAGPFNECSECYKVNENDLDHIDETVIFGGVMINHPGHLIIDSIAERLWWVLAHPECTYRIAVVTWVWGSKSAIFIKEFMDVLNIPEERLLTVDKPTQFKEIIVPDQSHVMFKLETPYEYTREFSSVFEYIRRNIKPSNYKKIYLSKSKTNKKNIIGEDFFINFYKNKGFKIIDPEDYSIREKAELLSGADEVVSLLGTNTHFAIFCKPTIKLTILSRTNSKEGDGQILVNQVSKIADISIVNVSSDFLHRNFVRGLALVCVTDEFQDYVKRIYGEDIYVTPEESLKNVLFEYLKYFPEYYSSPRPFDTIKNQKMITILQNMSEVFHGREFDSSRLNLTTKEDDLRECVKQLTADLNVSKKREIELESTDIFKAAKLLEATNVKFEEQLSQIHKTQQQTIDKLQTKIEELIGENKVLEESLQQKNVEKCQLDATIKDLSEKLIEAQSKAIELKDKIIEQEQLYQKQITKIAQLEKQISDYERLQSDAKNSLN